MTRWPWLGVAAAPSALALLSALLVTACSPTPPPVSLHNLERPSDMSFGCLGLFDLRTDPSAPEQWQVSGRPMSECHPPGQFDPVPTDIAHRTFAFVANSARGELSVIDMDASKLVDLDLGEPGTNVVPLGTLPEQISASDDGCRVITANRGSCSLSMVDPATLLTTVLDAEQTKLALDENAPPPANLPRPDPSTFAETVIFHTANGTALHLAPGEARFLPQDTALLTGTQNLCSRAGPVARPVGWPTNVTDDQWKALVSFPSCDLIALVNLPSGEIVSSVKVVSSGQGVQVIDGTSNPDCPATDFCDGPLPQGTAPDGGASADGGPTASDGGASSGPGTTGAAGLFHPGSLAILPNAARAYVGLDQFASVASVDIQPDHVAGPSYGGNIPLGEGAIGSDRVRLSVDPYEATGQPGLFGRFVGEGVDRSRQYLYVIARDGTVRVVDVASASQLSVPETECDTNIDPRYVPIDQRATIACQPLNPGLRRPQATGPGIRLPAVPRDVAVADLRANDEFSNREGVLDGVYAFILTSSGAVYIVNIDPTLRTKTLASGTLAPAPIPETPPLVNSLRDRNVLTYVATLDPLSGPPRVDVAPIPPVTGPALVGISITDSRDNPIASPVNPVPTYVFFPERNDVTPQQTWNITWEGDLSPVSFSGQFAFRDATSATLTDIGSDFCRSGVHAGDIVNLFGCTADQQCGPLEVCRRSPTAPLSAGSLPINGLCVPINATEQAARLTACAPLLETVRRYEIVEGAAPAGQPTVLTIRPKIDEVPTTLLNPCTADADCRPDSDPTREMFVCRLSDHRCVQPCTQSTDCRVGRTCVDFGQSVAGGGQFCADGPNLPASFFDRTKDQCLSQLTGYKLSVGNGFVVQGSAPAPALPVDPTNPICAQEPPDLSPATAPRKLLLINRIPIRPLVSTGDPEADRQSLICTNPQAHIPPGATTNDVQTILTQLTQSLDNPPPPAPALPPVMPTPNPCLIEQYADAAAEAARDHGHSKFWALFENGEIWFILGNLQDYFSDIPVTTFDVHGGFLPDTVVIPVTININLPIRIITSPIDSQTQAVDMAPTHELPYLFVIDQRRLGLAGAGVGPTRGQILRIHPRLPNTDSTTLLPTYEDLTITNGLWPIQ